MKNIQSLCDQLKCLYGRFEQIRARAINLHKSATVRYRRIPIC